MVEESPSKKSFQIHQRLHQRQRIESFHFVKDDFVANSGLAHSDNRCPPQVDGCLRLRHPELPPWIFDEVAQLCKGRVGN